MYKRSSGQTGEIEPRQAAHGAMTPGKQTLTEQLSWQHGARLPDGQIGRQVEFQAAEEAHHIWIEMKGGQAVVMVASNPQAAVTAIEKCMTWAGTQSPEIVQAMAPWAREAYKLLDKTEEAVEGLDEKLDEVDTSNVTTRLSHVKPSHQLAFCFERIFEIEANARLASSKKSITPAAAAKVYGQQLRTAFGASKGGGDIGFKTERGGKQDLPKTLAAVVATKEGGGQQVFFGQNAGQHDEENEYRATQIDAEVQHNKDVIDDHVIGSLVDNPRDLLNCAECLAIARAKHSGAVSFESQAVRREDTNVYGDCEPCANCQLLYGLVSQREIEQQQLREKKQQEKALREEYIQQQKKASQKSVVKRDQDAQSFETQVQQAVAESDDAELKKAFKRLYASRFFPRGKLQMRWQGGGDNLALLRSLIEEAKQSEKKK
jgi:cytidine deaminase